MTLPAGTRLGPYEILSAIGAGGMGEVYRARDTRLQRDVAVKILPAAFAGDADRLRRFEKEARSASAISDAHIVTVFDVGSEGGVPFFASELVEGGDLRGLLASGALPARKAVELAGQIASGLAAAHERGIVHRDLKPENILITKSGLVKIGDFGLARTVSIESPGSSQGPTATGSETEAGVVLGTLAYMSPEQARGQPVDARSDQFSLGAILYEMLVGRRAFQRGSAAETLSAILNEEAAPAASLHVPAPLAWIVDRCLAKDREERYASTRDLAADLKTCLQRSEAIRVDPADERAARGPGGRRALWRLAALGAAGIVLGAALALWLAPRAPRGVATLHFLTFSGHDSSPAVSPDGKTIAFVSDRDGRQRIWIRQFATAGEAVLTEGPDNSPRYAPDGSAILFARLAQDRTDIYRIATVGGEPRKIIEAANEADWSPDGKRIAYVRWLPENGGTSVGITDPDGTAPREIARVPQLPLLHPRWSPDGRTIALSEAANGGARRSLFFVSAADRSVRRVIPARQLGWLSSVAWSGSAVIYSVADSPVSATIGSSAHVFRQEVESEKTEELAWLPSSGQVLDVVSEGRLVFDINAVRENLREIRLPGAPGNEVITPLTRGNSTDRQPSYSPDGEWIIFSSNRTGNLDLWKISRKTGALRRLTDDAADDWDPAFSPDGKHILWSSNRTGSFEIWLADADGTSARKVSSNGEDAENPTMTPDGQWIVYGSFGHDQPGLWKVHPDGTGETQIRKGISPYPELSPDGQFVACRINDDPEHVTLAVVGIADGQPTAFRLRLEIRRGFAATSVGRSRWMPDGKSLVFVRQDERGVYGLDIQAFDPGHDTGATRRSLVPPDTEVANESFGISPDGSRITLAGWEQLSNLMVAEHVPDVEPPRRGMR